MLSRVGAGRIRIMTDALERAREDLAAGREWKARDRLTGLMAVRADDEVLDLLGEIYFTMRDLPSAGAMWVVTGRDGPEAQEAIAAWGERFPGPQARWGSIPARRRLAAGRPHLEELERAARAATQNGGGRRERVARDIAEERSGGPDWVGLALLAIAAVLVTLIVVGAVTVGRWIWS